MKTSNDQNVDSILKVTKNVIQSSDNFNNYYLNQNDSLYSDQIPLLNPQTSKFNSTSLILKREIDNNKINNTNTSFRTIRKSHERSDNIPKLCPLYNEQGELMPLVALNSKISFRTSYSFFPNPTKEDLGIVPMKKINRNYYIGNINDAYNNFEKEIFFNNDDYTNLSYDHKNIFINKEKYFDMIKNLVDNLKKEQDIDYLKECCKYEKNYEFGKKKKKMNLIFKSLSISFEDLNKSNTDKKEIKNKNLEIILPFKLLPIFYYKGEEIFKKLLTLIIKFDDNYEKVEFNYKNFSSFINNNIEFNNINEEHPNIMSNDNLPFIQPKEQIIQIDNKDKNIDEQKYVNIKIDDDNKKIIYQKKYHFIYPAISKSSHFLNYDTFNFIWVTPKKTFKVTINIPLISFSVPQNNIRIQQYIDFELLFYLISINFSKWDFYIMKYFSSFKRFRELLENLSSHKPKNYKKPFFLSPSKDKHYSIDNWEINNIHTDENSLSSILSFKPLYFYVHVFNNEKLHEDKYKIYFNFDQMTKFVKIEKYLNKILFFIKFLNISSNGKIVSYDYEKLNDFNVELWVKDITKFNLGGYFKEKIGKSDKPIIEFEGGLSFIKIQIELKEAEIFLKNLNDGKDILKNYSVTSETLNNITNEKDFNNYSSILINNLTKENEIIINDEIDKKRKN